MSDLVTLVETMEPAEAVRQMGPLLQRLLPHLDKEQRLAFIATLAGETEGDKVTSLVHL